MSGGEEKEVHTRIGTFPRRVVIVSCRSSCAIGAAVGHVVVSSCGKGRNVGMKESVRWEVEKREAQQNLLVLQR